MSAVQPHSALSSMETEYGSAAEGLMGRYRNAIVLAAALFVQIIFLAVQVKQPVDPRHPDIGSERLIRRWTVAAITPFEKIMVGSGHFLRSLWSGYIDLRSVHEENRRLKAELDELKIQQARWNEDASQARRLQSLLDFKQHFIEQTLAAQVIGSSGTEQSRVLYLDRGAKDGIRPDMAVITPDGIVGKIARVWPSSSQVLVINDPSNGVGALLESSRLHGIVRGTPAGDLMMHYVMQEENVAKNERVLTSGGDRIFPKGLPIGSITDISPGSDGFYNLRVQAAANLNKLEEVLVVTQKSADASQAENEAPTRAADILAQRLPTVHPKPAEEPKGTTKPTEAPAPPATGHAPEKPPSEAPR